MINLIITFVNSYIELFEMSAVFPKIVFTIFVLLLVCSMLLTLKIIQCIKQNLANKYEQTNGVLRQHGEYWVWHNYIRGDEIFNGNESLTITTHATYMDLSILPSLLKRWQAPLSLAIYACGSDFDQTFKYLGYLNGCLKRNDLMRRFLSIHLIFHKSHIPKKLDLFDISYTINPCECYGPPPYKQGLQELTYWYKQRLAYPVNLLRNVARLNAHTYYIMALDIHLIPTPNFAKKFLHFIWFQKWQHPDISIPYTSVFCLPTFAHKLNAPLAKNKDELLLVLNGFNITKPIYDDYEMQKRWIANSAPKDELSIFDRSSQMKMCVGYVSINEMEPLYDERSNAESIYENGFNLKGKLLKNLNYTFITLDGAFLIRHEINTWKNIDAGKPNMSQWLNSYKFYREFLPKPSL